jgi:dsRNA-specific ribonuclease
MYDVQTNSARILIHDSSQKYEFLHQHEKLSAAKQITLERALGCKSISHYTQLNKALTHPSVNSKNNYQRLEFLGDALLREILLFYILNHYSSLNKMDEVGEAISFLVSASTQAKIAEKLAINEYIFTKTALTEAILSDVLEALIAVIYLDKNAMTDTRECVLIWYEDMLNKLFRGTLSESAALLPSLITTQDDKEKQALPINQSLSSQIETKLSINSKPDIRDDSKSEPAKLTYAEVAKKTDIARNEHFLFQAKRNNRNNSNNITVPNVNSLVDFPTL